MIATTTTSTNTPRRAYPAAVRAALRSHIAHRIKRMTDAVGNWRDYQYDPNGNPVGQSLTLSGSLLDSSSAQYDISDRKTASIDAAGNATAYLYDTIGNLLKVTNPDNYSLSFEYDAANHVVKAYDEEGHAVSKTLDLDGKPRTVTDPNGNTLSYEYYDSARDGRLKKQTDAALRATTFDYDLNGNVTSVTDNLGRTTLTFYDVLNRAYRVVGPAYTDATLGQIRPVTRYTFDNLGNLITVAAGRTDSMGSNEAADQVTTQMTYVYDDFGRKIKETDPLGKFWTFDYDVNNNLIKTTDAKGQITRFTWNYGHQMLTRVDHTGKITSTLRNPLGQPTTVQSPEVTYSYAYDIAHRVKSVTDGRGGKELNYAWSPGGKLDEMVDSDGNRTDYLYDPVGRLSGVWAANDDFITFVYDAGGRLSEKWFPNGVNTQYTWNPDNTLAQIKNRANYNDSNLISRHDFTYNDVGQRNTAQDKLGVTLSPASNEAYSYDPIGNRSSKSDGTTPLYYKYDAANQLTEIHQTSASGPLLTALIYDANGSLIRKCAGSGVTTNGTTCSGSILTSFTYNALNQLVQLDKTNQPTQTYAYDDQGRRIKKSLGGIVTQYLHDGMNIHGEYTSWSKANAITTHGPSIDDPLVRITANDTRYYHKGGLGSIVATTNPTGTVTGTASYDAWGNTSSSTGNIPQYGYTGREPDETGLIYYRARYYDPTMGRFTQRDPIGFKGGMNQYAYGDPVNYTDPTGNDNLLYHGIQATQAAMSLGMGVWDSLVLGYNVAMQDIRTKSAADSNAMVQNLHGTGGLVDGIRQTDQQRYDGITSALNNPTPYLEFSNIEVNQNSIMASTIHTAQELPNDGHRNGTYEGISFNSVGSFLSSLGETTYHLIVEDTIMPLFNWDQRVENSVTAIQGVRNGDNFSYNNNGVLNATPNGVGTQKLQGWEVGSYPKF